MASADVATVKTKPTATNLIMASSNHVNFQEEIFTTRGRLAQFLRALMQPPPTTAKMPRSDAGFAPSFSPPPGFALD